MSNGPTFAPKTAVRGRGVVRCLRLLSELRGGRYRTKIGLAVTLQVSTRTILRDIAVLEEAGFLIEGEYTTEGLNTGRYRWTDADQWSYPQL